MQKVWIYIIKYSDDSYYTGNTQNLELRISQHNDGTFGGYTSKRRPVELVYSEPFSTYEEAFNAERQIKGWSRAKKEALIRGEFNLLHELANCRNESHYTNNKK